LLAAHLLSQENEEVRVIPARGLVSAGLTEQLDELTAGAITTRTAIPIYHVHFDPVTWDERVRAAFWRAFEQEFKLSGARYAGVIHAKHGRRHEHRTYDITDDGGKPVDLRFDFLRREKIAVLVAHQFGLAPPPIKHSRAVLARLRAEGQHQAADTLKEEVRRPVRIARKSPRERMIEDRAGASKEDAMVKALEAWKQSDNALSFVAALASKGLRLAVGAKAVVVVDSKGAAWPLARLIGEGSRREGVRIKAAVVAERVKAVELEALDAPVSERQDRESEPGALAASNEAAIGPRIADAGPAVCPLEAMAKSPGADTSRVTPTPPAAQKHEDGAPERERRLADARRRLAALNSPIPLPAELLSARNHFAVTVAVRSRCEVTKRKCQERIAGLQMVRPRGLWAWLTGRWQFYRRVLQLAEKRQASARHRLDRMDRILEWERVELGTLESAWDRARERIANDRIAERESLKSMMLTLTRSEHAVGAPPRTHAKSRQHERGRALRLR
jgi:hypothetical protein